MCIVAKPPVFDDRNVTANIMNDKKQKRDTSARSFQQYCGILLANRLPRV